MFTLHGTLGMGYASYLSWWPFRDCVLRQMRVRRFTMPSVPCTSNHAFDVQESSTSLWLFDESNPCGAIHANAKRLNELRQCSEIASVDRLSQGRHELETPPRRSLERGH